MAREEQQKYEANVKEDEICNKIKAETIRKIKEKFEPILIDQDEKNGIIKIRLLRLENRTGLLHDKNLDGYYSDIDGMFMAGIQNFLCKRNVLEVKNRFIDFADDNQYIEYLKSNNFNLFMRDLMFSDELALKTNK